MRSVAPALLPVFRSPLQASILAALLLNQDDEHSLDQTRKSVPAPR